MRKLSFKNAILEATDQMMKINKNIILIGLGAPDPKGIFGTTLGLQKKYGSQRVFDSPTAENSVTGIALGASLLGIRPIITHQRVEFSLLAIEQIVNQAAKVSYMTDGKLNAPMVHRLIIGRGWGQGPQHSQSLESWFANIPGLKVIIPSTPYDVKGLLISALIDNNPVILLEHRWLHETAGYVPEGRYEIEIGKANILKKGSDITIVSYSYMFIELLRCQKILEENGINAELIDLRSLRPLDEKTIIKSVKKTGHLLTIENGWTQCGVGSDIITKVIKKNFNDLKAAPLNLGLKDVPIPSSRSLANRVYVSQKDILKSIEIILNKKLNVNWNSLPKVQDTPDSSFEGPF